MGRPNVVLTAPRTVPVPAAVDAADWASDAVAQPRAMPMATHRGSKRDNDEKTCMRKVLEARACVTAQEGYDES